MAEEIITESIGLIITMCFVKQRLCREIKILSKEGLDSEILSSWEDALENTHNGSQKMDVFTKIFYDNDVPGRIIESICVKPFPKNVPLGRLSYLFALCLNGSEDFYFWFFKRLKKLSSEIKILDCSVIEEVLMILKNLLRNFQNSERNSVVKMDISLINKKSITFIINVPIIMAKIEEVNESLVGLIKITKESTDDINKYLFVEEKNGGRFVSLDKMMNEMKTKALIGINSNKTLAEICKKSSKEKYCGEKINIKSNSLKMKINQINSSIYKEEKIQNELEIQLKNVKERIKNFREEKSRLENNISEVIIQTKKETNEIFNNKEIIISNYKTAIQRQKITEILSSFSQDVKNKFLIDSKSHNQNHKNDHTLFLNTLSEKISNIFINLYTLLNLSHYHLIGLRNLFVMIDYNKKNQSEQEKYLSQRNTISKDIHQCYQIIQQITIKTSEICYSLKEYYNKETINTFLKKIPNQVISTLNLKTYFSVNEFLDNHQNDKIRIGN